MHLDELIAGLTRPEAYAHAPAEVTTLQTHISVLFFAGELVYKLKKPVDLGFLDFSTPENRRSACEAEVRLNAELAPGVYLRVADVTREPDGGVRVGGGGEVVDCAVEMRRLPAHRMLGRLLEEGGVRKELLDEIASILARFHARCPTGEGVDEHGSPEAVRANIEENLRRLAGHAGAVGRRVDPDGPVLSARRLSRLRAWSETELAARRALIARRVAEGRVREGHGDLHAENICLAPEGVLIYDRIEFNQEYRCLDVAAELAFLAMDLDCTGRPDLASRVCERYAEATGDPELLTLQPLYRFHYAVVRAMVEAMRAGEAEVDLEGRESAWLASRRHADLAAGYTLGPALVIACGLPATGKSTLARAVATPLRACVLRSDQIRKSMLGESPTARLGDAAYSSDVSDRVYAAMIERARELLAGGERVVLDATFPSRARRAPAVGLARDLGVPWAVAEATASEGTIRARMAARGADAGEVSDADLRVYESMRTGFERSEEIEAGRRVEVGEDVALEIGAGEVIDRLL